MTKQKKLIRNTVTGFLSLILIGLLTAVISCSHDEERYDVTHKVIYKAQVSAGSNITSVQYNIPTRHLEPVMNVNGTTWTSPEVAGTEKLAVGEVKNMGAIVLVKATGANASSTLKLQIYVDGVLKKEEVFTGQDLTNDIQYDIEYKVN